MLRRLRRATRDFIKREKGAGLGTWLDKSNDVKRGQSIAFEPMCIRLIVRAFDKEFTNKE